MTSTRIRRPCVHPAASPDAVSLPAGFDGGFFGTCGRRVSTRYDRKDRKVTYTCQVKDSARTPPCGTVDAVG